MATERKYHRVSDGMIAGVCAGVAETRGMDALPLRVLFVLLFLSTFGIFGLVYVALALAWPCEYHARDPYDLEESDAPGVFRRLSGEYAGQVGSADTRRPDAPPPMGHVPPLPPRAYVERYGTAAVPFFQYARLWMAGELPSLSEERRREVLEEDRGSFDRAALVLIVLGAFVLTIVLNALINQALQIPNRLNLQPFFLVLLGLTVIMAPVGNLPAPARVVEGVAVVFLGVFGTLVSIDVMSAGMLRNPLVVGLTLLLVSLILGALEVRKRWFFVLVAVFALIFLFVVLGPAHVPGALNQVTLHLLFGDPFTVVLNPWR